MRFKKLLKVRGSQMKNFGTIPRDEDWHKRAAERDEQRRAMLEMQNMRRPEQMVFPDRTGKTLDIKTNIPPKFKREAVDKWTEERDAKAIERMMGEIGVVDRQPKEEPEPIDFSGRWYPNGDIDF